MGFGDMLSIHYFLSNSCLNLKALSASGLRALRYAREVEGIDQVVALDNDKGNILVIGDIKNFLFGNTFTWPCFGRLVTKKANLNNEE